MTAQTSKVVDIAQWRKSTVPEMNAFQFQQWTGLLAKRTGITLPESRRSFLLSSLNIRMYELGIESYQAYYNYLHSGHAGNIEWATLVDRLTVHETRFFRDQQALNLIRDVYLEQFEEKSASDSINVWSVGCATGEESYSLAIELDRYLNDSGKKFYYAVTGSDISPAAITSARKAVYKSARLSNVPEKILEQYLDKTASDEFQVKPFLRQRVCFNQMNLLDL
ncbi:MAG: CheR family methyltransferase, partial [Thioalkalispiraceae bacterium]